MTKKEIFQHILDVVANETEVSQDYILGGRKDGDTVDARHLLVYMLFVRGFSVQQIAKLIHKTSRGVNTMIANIPDRLRSRKILRIQKENIVNMLGIN